MPEFNWRNYIEIDKSVPYENAKIISDMLDREFRDKNKNGLPDEKIMGELLNITKQNGGKKIQITSEVSEDGSYMLPDLKNGEYTINLDFEQLKKLRYIDLEDGNVHKATLNSVFRHELKHAADYVSATNKLLKTGLDIKEIAKELEKDIDIVEDLEKKRDNIFAGKECDEILKELECYQKKWELPTKLVGKYYKDRYNLEKDAVTTENSFYKKSLYKNNEFERGPYALSYRDEKNPSCDVEYIGLKNKNFDPKPLGKAPMEKIDELINKFKEMEKDGVLSEDQKKWFDEIMKAQEKLKVMDEATKGLKNAGVECTDCGVNNNANLGKTSDSTLGKY